MEIAMDETVAGPVREAARRAFRRVGGADLPLSVLFANLARQYFNEMASLIAYPYEPTNNVWDYDPFVGLIATPVPTEVFGQIMAMRHASTSLSIDPTNGDALSLFVAANLKRENDLPPGEVDPVYADTQYSPSFYATVFGTNVAMDVLAMALDSYDTPLVRDALAALAFTTGGSNLFAGNRDRQPLLEALQYPDRRVQYEAALTLGRALPQQTFAGDIAVVPLLASAVRSSNQSFALVIADNDEDQRVTTGRLEQLGFTVLGSASSVASLELIVADAVGLDLVVLRQENVEEAKAAIADLRILPKATAAPVLLIASSGDLPMLRREFRTDARVLPAPWRDEAAFAAAVDDLLRRAVGGRMDEAEAEIYAIEALGVLRDIAVTRNQVYTIADAESALLDALDLRSGGTRMLVAKILALVNTRDAQQKLFDAALAAEGSEQVKLLGYVADSVKRFGSMAADRHERALLQMVADATGDTAEAAARVHGAMNLPPEQAVELLP
jgi:hypothetical protein